MQQYKLNLKMGNYLTDIIKELYDRLVEVKLFHRLLVGQHNESLDELIRHAWVLHDVGIEPNITPGLAEVPSLEATEVGDALIVVQLDVALDLAGAFVVGPFFLFVRQRHGPLLLGVRHLFSLL